MEHAPAADLGGTPQNGSTLMTMNHYVEGTKNKCFPSSVFASDLKKAGSVPTSVTAPIFVSEYNNDAAQPATFAATVAAKKTDSLVPAPESVTKAGTFVPFLTAYATSADVASPANHPPVPHSMTSPCASIVCHPVQTHQLPNLTNHRQGQEKERITMDNTINQFDEIASVSPFNYEEQETHKLAAVCDDAKHGTNDAHSPCQKPQLPFQNHQRKQCVNEDNLRSGKRYGLKQHMLCWTLVSVAIASIMFLVIFFPMEMSSIVTVNMNDGSEEEDLDVNSKVDVEEDIAADDNENFDAKKEIYLGTNTVSPSNPLSNITQMSLTNYSNHSNSTSPFWLNSTTPPDHQSTASPITRPMFTAPTAPSAMFIENASLVETTVPTHTVVDKTTLPTAPPISTLPSLLTNFSYTALDESLSSTVKATSKSEAEISTEYAMTTTSYAPTATMDSSVTTIPTPSEIPTAGLVVNNTLSLQKTVTATTTNAATLNAATQNKRKNAGFSFFLMGDIPYIEEEEIILAYQLEEIATIVRAHYDEGRPQQPVAFIVHVGDFGNVKHNLCEEKYFQRINSIFISHVSFLVYIFCLLRLIGYFNCAPMCFLLVIRTRLHHFLSMLSYRWSSLCLLPLVITIGM